MFGRRAFLGYLIPGAVGLAVVAALTGYAAVDYLVELKWFDSLGYQFYFWQRLLYRYVVFSSVALLFFMIFFLNFHVASRYIGRRVSETGAKPAEGGPFKRLFARIGSGSAWVYTPLSLMLALMVALPIFKEWESFLLYVFGRRTGVEDPVYGKDISYYLFSYPVYSLLQRRLLLAFGVLLLGLAVLYWMKNRQLGEPKKRFSAAAKWHLGILSFLVFSIEIWNFVLQRHGLLFSTENEPFFFGPGFTQMNVILPAIWTVIVLLAATALALVYVILTRKGRKILTACAVVLLLSIGSRYATFLPDMVHRYYVEPNQISKERPYIENSIRATLSAYDLNRVETREFNPEHVPPHLIGQEIKDIFGNVPVWDAEVLNRVYEQLQQLRTYYSLSPVDVMHYNIDGHNQQVFLAAREMNLGELPSGARTWVNEHLVYTHGYGAVMTPAGQGGDQPLRWYMRGIPLESENGLKVEQPAIYFGLLDNYGYAIVPNDAGEFGYPRGDTNVEANYEGKGGVPIASLFDKLLFSLHLQDKEIFFTTKTNEKSRILFRRNIRERIETLTPFLHLDGDPYLAVTPKRFYWIQDAYTLSDKYPNAERYLEHPRKPNYIRNSVKVVVDAYDGTTDYYVFDPQDPFIVAYSRMYPGLFKNRDRMPETLRAQVRYPQDLFNIQMSIYAKYQQRDPEVFYQQEDMWDFANATLTASDREPLLLKSYYVTLDLMEPGRFDFMLLAPMTPKSRANLRSLALVGADRANYGKIVVYTFPKGELVYGPSQVHALINQNTDVAEQFALWDQAGSRVERGKMIILPIGKTIVYIQPVYLESATETKIPELKRLIMTQGDVVVMEQSLEQAYTKLEERMNADVGRQALKAPSE